MAREQRGKDQFLNFYKPLGNQETKRKRVAYSENDSLYNEKSEDHIAESPECDSEFFLRGLPNAVYLQN